MQNNDQTLTLPVCLAYDLAKRPTSESWLIEGLWTDQAVGILGGEPKCCKSFLALDMAVAVATGKPCLRHFPVKRQGPALIFPAEDSAEIVRTRLEGICHASQTPFDTLPVHVITAARLLLDQPEDRRLLHQIVKKIKPALLILDPFIRLHRADENASNQVAPLLGYLRDIQRELNVAVLLVHHVRKRAGKERPGQALRGSSDLHGWGDSNLYLRRQHNTLTLSIEHRAAASPSDLNLQLLEQGDALALQVLATNKQTQVQPLQLSTKETLLSILAKEHRPLLTREIRDISSLRMETVCATLKELREDNKIINTARGYIIKAAKQCLRSVSVSRHSIGCKGNGNGKSRNQIKPSDGQLLFNF